MAKTISFAEKQNSKVESKKLYDKAFLRVYEAELKKKYPEEEVKARVDKKAAKLEKKLAKKVENNNKAIYQNRSRIWELDFIRGLVIIGMLIDHFFFDFEGLFTSYNFSNLPQFYLDIGAFANLYWVHPVRVTFRFIGIFFLFLVSGISTQFSRNPIRRSLIVIAAGALMSVAFIVVAKVTGNMEDLVIVGAIGGIGICMFIYGLFRLPFKSHPQVHEALTLGIALAILIGWAFVSYNNARDTSNFWFYYNGYAYSIPIVRYKDLGENIWGVLLGTKYFGSDWMGLFPGLGYMFLGGFIGETVYRNRKSIFGRFNEFLNRNTKLVTIPGKYSLWFYLSHQLIYIIILGGIALLMGAKLAL